MALLALVGLGFTWVLVFAALSDAISNRVVVYGAAVGIGTIFLRIFNRLDDIESARRAGDEQPRRPSAEPGKPQDARVLARRLVELLENSRPLPLTGQVRVEKLVVYEVVAGMRAAQDAQDAAGADRSAHAIAVLLEAAEQVEDAVYHAMPVPVMDEVRLPRERVAELVRGLRAAGA